MFLPLVVTAALLAVIYGANAGGTMVAIGLGVNAVPPLVAVLALAVAVATMPAVVGTAVATTLASDMVTMRGPDAQLLTLEATVAAIVVIGVLGVLGIPTSLTLGLVGGLAGVSLGAGSGVVWSRLALVFAMLGAAPIVGAFVAHWLSRLFLSRRASTTPNRSRLVRLQLIAFTGLIVAFGAGDAQKLLAVMAVGVAGTGGTVHPTLWGQSLLGILFAAGSALGMRRMARSTNAGVIALRPLDAVVAQTATAGVMTAGVVVGSPAGMAQTLSGSLVGAGVSKGIGTVRWDYASRILGAWIMTLPSAFVLSLALGLATRWLD